MSDIYKLQYNGMTLAYPGWNGYVCYENQSFKTLTLLNSEGGTLTANTLTGYPGDTINLSTAYNTYWRFSGYQWTGDGSLVGNDYTFGTEDATICACFKPNAFTATGGWEKGKDINCASPFGNAGTNTASIGPKYAIHGSHTGDIPTAWYATSNRWKVTTTPSAYNITLNTKMKLGGRREGIYGSFKVTGWSFVGSTTSNSQSWTNTNPAWYNKTFTSNITGVNYGVDGKLYAETYIGYRNTASYFADGTSGTWTATGYAP